MTGITTFEDLRERCVIDDITGCWHYAGSFTHNPKTGGKTATLWYPPLQRTISASKAIGLMNAQAPGKGQFWFRACRTWDCVCPEHHRIGTRSEMSRFHRPSNTPLHNAQISAAQRRIRGLPGAAFAKGASVFNMLGNDTVRARVFSGGGAA